MPPKKRPNTRKNAAAPNNVDSPSSDTSLNTRKNAATPNNVDNPSSDTSLNTRKNAATPNKVDNPSSDTSLETLVANAVNSAISELLPNLMAQTAQTLFQQLQQANNVGNAMLPPRENPVPPHVGNAIQPSVNDTATSQVGIHVWVERFMIQKPRIFTKATTPADAKHWISHIEKIFTVLGVDSQYKSRLAAYRLEKGAQNWWESILRERGGDQFAETLPWEGFRTMFLEKYCSDIDIEMYIQKYHSIRQRYDETLNAYTGRFYQLVGCLGDAAGPPEEQAEKYQWGVCDRIRSLIIHSTFSTVEEAVNAAKKADLEKTEFTAMSDDNRKRNRDGNPIQAQPNQTLIHPCASCGKTHRGVCRLANGLCFRCGETGHLSKDCNKLSHAQANSGPSVKPRKGKGQNLVRIKPYEFPIQAQPFNQQPYQNLNPSCTCGKQHPGSCRKSKYLCLRGDKTGHKVEDCNLPPTEADTGGNAAQHTGGRVLALAGEDVADAPGINGNFGGVKMEP